MVVNGTDWKRGAIEIASLARRAMAPGLEKDGSGRAVYEGSCLYGSILLCELIERFAGGDAKARVIGGSGAGSTGALDRSGFWRGHYWVEASRGGETLVIDITGDQFGMEAVRILDPVDALAVLRPGEQQEVDEAAGEIRASLGMG